ALRIEVTRAVGAAAIGDPWFFAAALGLKRRLQDAPRPDCHNNESEEPGQKNPVAHRQPALSCCCRSSRTAWFAEEYEAAELAGCGDVVNAVLIQIERDDLRACARSIVYEFGNE